MAGWFLWQTTVPDLELAHVDVHRYWSERALHRAARFDGFVRWRDSVRGWRPPGSSGGWARE